MDLIYLGGGYFTSDRPLSRSDPAPLAEDEEYCIVQPSRDPPPRTLNVQGPTLQADLPTRVYRSTYYSKAP